MVGKLCSVMHALITCVRCGTISVIPSLKAHAGIVQGPNDLLTFNDFTTSKTSLVETVRKLKEPGTMLSSLKIGVDIFQIVNKMGKSIV